MLTLNRNKRKIHKRYIMVNFFFNQVKLILLNVAFNQKNSRGINWSSKHACMLLSHELVFQNQEKCWTNFKTLVCLEFEATTVWKENCYINSNS